MFKFIIACSLLISSTVSTASPIEQALSVKDRLRISLWIEGLQPYKKHAKVQRDNTFLPEELERPLRKL